MKKKLFAKKMTLNKTTVANLSVKDQKKVKGGSGTDDELVCAYKRSEICTY